MKGLRKHKVALHKKYLGNALGCSICQAIGIPPAATSGGI